VAWGVFNVPGDLSRSGAAPVRVPGAVRLALEVVILGAGAAGFAIAGLTWIAVAFAVLVVLHYLASVERLRWLLAR